MQLLEVQGICTMLRAAGNAAFASVIHSFIHIRLLTSLVKTQECTQWARYELKKSMGQPVYTGYNKHVSWT